MAGKTPRLTRRPGWLVRFEPRTRLQRFVHEFLLFGFKQGWSSLFSGLLLLAIVATKIWWPFETLHRYDFLFVFAVVVQIGLLAARLETPREAIVIVVFHVVATVMELFKTSPSIGSWIYPEPAVIKVGNVPLFAGFMYSAVGSYIARAWRVFHLEFDRFPRRHWLLLLAAGIYVNFFTHHFIWDARWLLLLISFVLLGRSKVFFVIDRKRRSMPLLFGLVLVALFIWLAENLATLSSIWLYPDQLDGWRPVSPQKIVAWYLLMLISFALVSTVNGRSLPGKRR